MKKKTKNRVWLIIGIILGNVILYRVLTPFLKIVFGDI